MPCLFMHPLFYDNEGFKLSQFQQTPLIWLSFLFAFWIYSPATDFPKGPSFVLIPSVSWTAVCMAGCSSVQAKQAQVQVLQIWVRVLVIFFFCTGIPPSPRAFLEKLKREGVTRIWLFTWVWRFKKEDEHWESCIKR